MVLFLVGLHKPMMTMMTKRRTSNTDADVVCHAMESLQSSCSMTLLGRPVARPEHDLRDVVCFLYADLGVYVLAGFSLDSRNGFNAQ